MDEARHFEVLTRLYRTLECDPLGLRDLPELLVYHHRLRQGDRIDWVWGILFSDLVGKHFYRAFAGATSDPFRTGATSDPFLAGLSTRILQDESRHLAFAEHYLRRNLASASDSRRRALLEMRDDLFRLLEAMTARVRADAAELELDADLYLGRVWADVDSFGRRIGLTAPPSEPSSDPPADRPGHLLRDPPPHRRTALPTPKRVMASVTRRTMTTRAVTPSVTRTTLTTSGVTRSVTGAGFGVTNIVFGMCWLCACAYLRATSGSRPGVTPPAIAAA